MLGHQPAEPTTDSEARYPGAGDLTAGRGETECRCGAVEFAPDNPALRSYGALFGVDVDSLHRREVDHEPALGDRPAGDVVTATADRDLHSLFPPDVDGVDDICGV